MHEIGHNLGHDHSGKDGVTYADPTCHMGDDANVWSDKGTNFCFNAAKTWANKWYASYHETVDPSRGTYFGTLVGINAVKNNTIAESGQDIVLKIASSGESDLYVMFNRKTGANKDVPLYGDQVVIVEQRAELQAASSLKAALSAGQEYTQSWSASGTLVVKVCNLEIGSPGSARIVVYATGQAMISCDTTNTPTASPVRPSSVVPTFTSSPVLSLLTFPPTKAPVFDGSCQDRIAKFAMTNGKKIHCKYVSKNRLKRCKDPAVVDHCPVTCGKIGCVCKDILNKFTLPRNGRLRSCAWAARTLSKTKKRCRKSIMRSHCPETCGVCIHF